MLNSFRKSSDDRPYLQCLTDELRSEFEHACLQKDLDKACDILHETTFRKRLRALRLKEDIESKLDLF